MKVHWVEDTKQYYLIMSPKEFSSLESIMDGASEFKSRVDEEEVDQFLYAIECHAQDAGSVSEIPSPWAESVAQVPQLQVGDRVKLLVTKSLPLGRPLRKGSMGVVIDATSENLVGVSWEGWSSGHSCATRLTDSSGCYVYLSDVVKI